MTYQTIQSRYARKHLDRVSNVRVYSLHNSFRGELIDKHSRYRVTFANHDNGGSNMAPMQLGFAAFALVSLVGLCVLAVWQARSLWRALAVWED